MDDVEEIKKRIDIVEFIGQYLQLKKAGVNHSGLCPFHEEKTPSFMVSPQRQSYKCFGCSEAGDVISFFMKMEGFSFPEALRVLGERVGVQVSLRPKEDLDREKSFRDKILNINLTAAKYYKAIMWQKQGELALEYLKKRQVPPEIIQKFKLGYAPGINNLDKYLNKYKFSYAEIKAAGNPQRFKYRIIFPIFDTLGFVVGFSGRIFESQLPQGMSPNPKYLNTPETPVFHKSRVLYGLNFAKDAIRKNKRVVVVEGQMDVISSHIGGVEEVVASSGTALTVEHLKILKRYTNDVIFAFDEDEAGQKAALSAILMGLELGLDIKLTVIEGFKDVGELVEKGGASWAKVLSSALPPVEWLAYKAKKDTDLSSAQGKKLLVNKAVPIIRKMEDEVERSHYVSYLAKTIGIPSIAIEKSLSKIKASKERAEERPVTTRDLELDILSFAVNYPIIAMKTELISAEFITNKQYQQFYNLTYKCYNSNEEVKECINKAVASFPEDLKSKIQLSAIEWDQKVAENEGEALSEFVDIQSKIRSGKKEEIKMDFAKKIAEAESSGDMSRVRSLMEDLQKSLKEK